MADAEQSLYEGSEGTKLELILIMHNWKARFGFSDSALRDFLFIIGSLLPKGNMMLHDAYDVKKTLSDKAKNT